MLQNCPARVIAGLEMRERDGTWGFPRDVVAAVDGGIVAGVQRKGPPLSSDVWKT